MSSVREAMAGTGNVNLLKTSYDEHIAMGERATQDCFVALIEEYPNARYLIHSTQIPRFARDPVELYGEHGVQADQQGRLVTKQELPITFTETIRGHLYTMIRKMIINKEYVTFKVYLNSESNEVGVGAHLFTLNNCWIELDGADLSKEDATLIQPSGTIRGAYFPEIAA